ncbi:hypothetical protein O181_018973 [Austropuccinia psidii MF-1]|uniref:Integrase zinc-binding domain-containing protein n=1 Tax=Austropuccinia psidii MF-1 TaxID=1389203 RepID=A0A9Q3GT64_9BASI|nr:hypothetical protein [Austropuccinia psidii MF-1]
MNPLPCSSFMIQNSPKGEDLILDYYSLHHFNPIIDCKNGLITYDSSHKGYSGIIPSTSNDFATSVNSVALVGEIKTPSLPYSVHIPSIIPSQSLLLSTDEVFKEIKDFGEEVAISSLHLFQGDMDFPPLSFHSSLEEQWDEEEQPEEIETVLKVLSPAYHKYLDLFSKVKAEKLPPHCICAHHIQLEGLLPPEALSQFQILKEAFTISPILSHLNPSLPTIVETEASDYALGAVLSQVNDSGKHPFELDSHKPLPAELNYEINDKELLGIVWALKRWRAFLISLSNHFEAFTHHYSLQYFMSSKVLTCFQACWAEFLSEFHFTINYHPGRLATLPDAWSYGNNMYLERGVDFIGKNPQNFHQVIKKHGIQESILFSIKVEIFSNLVDQIQKEVLQDKDYKEILKQLARGESVSDYSLEPKAKLLLFKDGVVIPRNEEIQLNILQKHHDSQLAGDPGQEKTLKLIKRDFYWAGMNQFIKDYMSSCQQCSRNNNIHHKKFGLLKPLQIPSGPWDS